jgi:hypothetical protein
LNAIASHKIGLRFQAGLLITPGKSAQLAYVPTASFSLSSFASAFGSMAAISTGMFQLTW